jgi:hypothetical protein
MKLQHQELSIRMVSLISTDMQTLHHLQTTIGILCLNLLSQNKAVNGTMMQQMIEQTLFILSSVMFSRKTVMV